MIIIFKLQNDEKDKEIDNLIKENEMLRRQKESMMTLMR